MPQGRKSASIRSIRRVLYRSDHRHWRQSDAASTHFIEHGRSEKRKVDSFDAPQYLANYGDLRAAFGNDQHAATVHYITHGFAEHRNDDPHGGATAADFLL